VFRLVRGSLAVFGGVVLVGAAVNAANWVGFTILKSRLNAQYAMVQKVHKGMPRTDVLRIIAAQQAPALARADNADGGVTVWTSYSLMEVCYTSFEFKSGLLVATYTTESDMGRPCPGAPPDIR
jgi:hypothetical protein